MSERWRVGNHQPRNIYFDDREVAVAVGGDVEAEAVAALVVQALNALHGAPAQTRRIGGPGHSSTGPGIRPSGSC